MVALFYCFEFCVIFIYVFFKYNLKNTYMKGMKFFLIILFLIIITNCSLIQKTQEISTETVSAPHYLSMDCESLAVEHNSVLRDFEKYSLDKSAGLSAAKIAVVFIEDQLRDIEKAYKINECVL